MLDTIAAAPRLRLAHLPTPLEPCPRLSAHLGGPQIWVKRDDCTGLALGGNKVRKLEFVLGEAVAAGADALVSAGVVQSNHVRQTAAAAARQGLEFHAAIITDRVPGTDPDYVESGNFLLDALFGMRARFCSVDDDRVAVMHGIMEDLRKAGKRPFLVAYGASDVTGALGYVNFAAELSRQLDALDLRPAALVHASGSSGTQAGIMVGAVEFLPGLPVIGIDIDAEPERVRADVIALAAKTAGHCGRDIPDLDDRIEVVGGHAGPGYGVVTPETMEAIELFARFEGLLLDPVYSGKGAAGLVDLVRRGRFDRRDAVIFLHTGGAPALYSYRSHFAPHMGAVPESGCE